MLIENDQIISDETTISDTMDKNLLKLKPTETKTNEHTLLEI